MPRKIGCIYYKGDRDTKCYHPDFGMRRWKWMGHKICRDYLEGMAVCPYRKMHSKPNVVPVGTGYARRPR